eukprot:6211991-Pleurochrysis_carterae.AAC.2
MITTTSIEFQSRAARTCVAALSLSLSASCSVSSLCVLPTSSRHAGTISIDSRTSACKRMHSGEASWRERSGANVGAKIWRERKIKVAEERPYETADAPVPVPQRPASRGCGRWDAPAIGAQRGDETWREEAARKSATN